VGGPFELEDEELVDLGVEGLFETRKLFHCTVEGMKYGTREIVSETTSQGSSCSNLEEAFTNLMP
jgi:hypothetical protein